MLKHKPAFTLAEALITLMIIGVIAAITIPSLIQNYKKHLVENQLKKAYALAGNILKMASVKNGGSIDDAIQLSMQQGDVYSKINYFAQNYIEPNIQFSKKGIAKNEASKVFTDTFLRYMNGSNPNMLSTSAAIMAEYLLKNGMFFGVGMSRHSDSFTFAFDINGAKPPNLLGCDIFYFAIQSQYPNKLVAGVYSDEGGINTNWNGCDDDYQSANCASVIMNNGWKIPDNYPCKSF